MGAHCRGLRFIDTARLLRKGIPRAGKGTSPRTSAHVAEFADAAHPLQAGNVAQGNKQRRVAKVEHHARELFPRVGFIVINLTVPRRAVVRFYNERGTSKQWIKEGKQAVKMTRLSCHRFRPNQVRLWLNVMAYNLGSRRRRPALPNRIDKWSVSSLQQRLVKTGRRLVKHA